MDSTLEDTCIVTKNSLKSGAMSFNMSVADFTKESSFPFV